MANNSIDMTKKQRHTELMKVFELLKEKWPECFDNIGMYLPEARLAVCKNFSLSIILLKIYSSLPFTVVYHFITFSQVLEDHPLFEYISDLFDMFCGREARQRKKEILNKNIPSEKLHIIVNTVIADFAEKVLKQIISATSIKLNFQYIFALFRNADGTPAYVLGGLDEKSLVKLNGKYHHFEAIKPNEQYLQRLQSGPIEDFEKTAQKMTDLAEVHGPTTNFDEDDEDDDASNVE